jgi:hypothetical protein
VVVADLLEVGQKEVPFVGVMYRWSFFNGSIVVEVLKL